ncbi:diguanylate cyclase domain-containing protein [Salinisphaera sp. Q1T1-3]|uniref:two-component system response regulator n=1 Tax=Salinisphaera sp. Q1T1-3 TaxID=2321229 RepID=UPI000E7399E4|nr:diguanylate cyclase [Salinisphaera sp. Q1T1-3]RJS95010.1 diguanylate cyclase [Salinisphaera sp. Q1T1-3]
MRDPQTATVAAPKVLVVDDLYANRLSMRHILSGLHVEIVEADSGNQALAACLDHEFALILLDVQMPGMDGVEVAELIQGDDQLRETPIIFVTAGATEDMDRLKGYDVGAVDYISKPLNPGLLAAKVRNFLELYANRCALVQAMADLTERNAQLQAEVERRKAAEARAQRLATHDALTGLPNRLLFLDRLRQAMARADRGRRPFALGYLDLDGFKPVNDTHGHRAGDHLLESLAARMTGRLRQCDTVARLGGDEFAVLFDGVADGSTAEALAETLRAEIVRPVAMIADDGGAPVSLQVDSSLGIALYPGDAEGPDALMHQADCALYEAKAGGKGRVRIHNQTA